MCFFLLWLSFTANVEENAFEFGVLRAIGLNVRVHQEHTNQGPRPQAGADQIAALKHAQLELCVRVCACLLVLSSLWKW